MKILLAGKTKCVIVADVMVDDYSYRSDSTGVISAARWAGYMPAVTVIKESVRTEAIIEMVETIGCGTKSGSGTALIAAQTPTQKLSQRIPLTIVSMADSAKNCRRMSRLVAPIALRVPISRVRSVTETSMMFITPIPPKHSVTMATQPKKIVTTPKISSSILAPSIVSQMKIASLSTGSKW